MTQRHVQIPGLTIAYRSGDAHGPHVVLCFKTERDAQAFMCWLNEEGALS